MATSKLLLIVFALALSCMWGTSADPLVSRLPASNSIDGWTMSGNATVLRNESALYNQIDGAGPKFLERGWVGGAYANYVKGTEELYVAIHDLKDANNAKSMYEFELPTSREPIPNQPNAVVDLGIPDSYRAVAFVGQYLVEVSITERSDAALSTVKRFVVTILGHGP